MIYFTADTHYFHKNIIKFCDRPYVDVEAMNEDLIARWNAVVQPKDDVYHLGDVTFGDEVSTANILGRLHGRTHLVPGNHDDVKKIGWMFGEVLPQYHELKINRQKIVLCHFPIENFRGNFHLHGHTHGTATKRSHRRDVGVDCYNYTPVSLDQLVEEIKHQDPDRRYGDDD